MEEKFFEFYRPSDNGFKILWGECIFVFDTNVLLNLYRYSSETSKSLLGLIEKISERVWIPHQVALEYHRNRYQVIFDQIKAYEEIKKQIEKSKISLIEELNKKKRHYSLNIESIIKKTENSIEAIELSVTECQIKHPDLFSEDNILMTITSIFKGKVGNPYTEEDLISKYTEAEKRFSLKIPPGYKDEKAKDGPKKYGDVILWFQILEYAKEMEKPIILITDDLKEDWWDEFNGRTIGPKKELIREMSEKAKTKFYMYNTEQFLTFANKYLIGEVAETAIQEVKHTIDTDRHELKFINIPKKILSQTHKYNNYISLKDFVIDKSDFNYNSKYGHTLLKELMIDDPEFALQVVDKIQDKEKRLLINEMAFKGLLTASQNSLIQKNENELNRKTCICIIRCGGATIPVVCEPPLRKN